MANGNLSKRFGLLGSLDDAALERLEKAAVEKLGAMLDGKADKDEVYTKEEASALFDDKPYIINAVYNPEGTSSQDIITYPEGTESPDSIRKAAVEAYNAGRQVILRVDGLVSSAVDFVQAGLFAKNRIKFYGVVEDTWYEIAAVSTSFTTHKTPLAESFIVNAVIDKDKNVSTDIQYSELEDALEEGRQLMLMLDDKANGMTVFGQMSARTKNGITWHLCLGTETYEISCERVFNTDTYDEIWKAEFITMATDAELDKVFNATEEAIVKIGSYYGEEDEDGAQDVMLHGDSRGYGSQVLKLFRLTRTVKDASDDLPTSGAVYDAIKKVSAIAKGRATGYVFDTKEDMDEWLGVEENKAALKLGDNLYIRDVGVPDYWWDEQTQTAQILETQKVELTEYAKKADTVVEVVATSSKASSDVHYYYINYKDGKGEYSSTRLFNADNSQPTEGSDNLITSGAVYNAMGDIENALDGIIAIQNTLQNTLTGGESE